MDAKALRTVVLVRYAARHVASITMTSAAMRQARGTIETSHVIVSELSAGGLREMAYIHLHHRSVNVGRA